MLSSASQLLDKLLCAMETSVSYVVERNYLGYPSELTGDVDIVVGPEDMQRSARIILTAAEGQGWTCFFALHRPYVHYLGLCTKPDFRDSRSVLIVELFAGGVWYANSYVSATYILENRRKYRDFYVPDAGSEAVLTLFHHLLWNRRVPLKYRTRLSDLVVDSPARFLSLTEDAFGRSLSRTVHQYLVDGRWGDIERIWWQFALQLVVRKSLRSPWAFTKAWLLAILSLLRSSEPGILLLLVGDDTLYLGTIAESMGALAEEWHIFLPSVRRTIQVSSQQEFERQKATICKIAQRAIKKGGVAIISLPDRSCSKVLTDKFGQSNSYTIHMADGCIELDGVSVAWDAQSEFSNPIELAPLLWAEVLTKHSASRGLSGRERIT